MTAGPNIAVVDYGMGNRRSVQKALEHVGARAEITAQHELIRRADGVVVPGVGAFPLAMQRLNESGLAELIVELAGQDTPILGICLGMQLLFDRSEELGSTAGLGLIGGEVTWLDSGGRRIPHIGWNEVRFERSSPLTDGLRPGGAPFYHVHSLAPHPRDPAEVVGSTEYGERFATIVARGSIYGVQFHPEKSSRHGLQMLGNFAAICARSPVGAG
ncbi:MAG: imidazole glycerol phosphate synthase subunit HisH [Solirubrobacteraceae bacterium]|jgi:imidazole glycerol-phosphate synthase subunit HisH